VDAVDGVFAGTGEQGGVGADADEPQALVGVSARGFGVGGEDAGGEAGGLGRGEDALQRVLECRGSRVAGHAEIVGEVAGADEQDVDPGHLGDLVDPLHRLLALDLDDAQDALVRGGEPFGVQAEAVGAVVGGDAAVAVRG
jgi:hypothetical protein